MTKRKPLVIVTRKLPDVVETRMMELFNTRLNADDHPSSKAELIEAVKQAEVLVPTVTDRIDKAVIAPGRRPAQADRQFRHRRRQYRCRDGGCPRHHRHQHAGRPHRGHRRHDHGPDHGGGAAHDRRCGRSSAPTTAGRAGRRPGCSARRIWGKRLGIIGMGRIGRRWPARQGLRAPDPLSQPQAGPSPRSTRNSRRPIGKASTRCWRAWTSSRSIARTRRRPIICSRRAGSS